MKRKLTGCLILVAPIVLVIFIACGFDYTQYDAAMNSPRAWVGVEFSSEWGSTVPFKSGMTFEDAVKQAVENQIVAGSTAVVPLRRALDSIDSARLLRRHEWSYRRAMSRMLILPVLVDTAPLFDDEVLDGPKRSWKLQPGDYVTFEQRK